MRLSRVGSVVLMKISAFLLLTLSWAQSQTFAAPLAKEWAPQGVDVLRQKASSKTEFTLDHSMLVLASKLEGDNQDLRRVIAGVNGVSVHSFRFAGPGTYDAAALDSLKEEYRTAGWTQVMKNEKVGQGATTAWMRLENNAISNVALLVAKPNEVDLVMVSGSISPLDLSHLGGHFGIPKIEGGVVLPKSEGHP